MAEGGPLPSDDDEDIQDLMRTYRVIRDREIAPVEFHRFVSYYEEFHRHNSLWYLYTPANLNTFFEIYAVGHLRLRLQRWSYQNPSPVRLRLIDSLRQRMPMAPETDLVISLSWDARDTLSPAEYFQYRAIWDDVRSALIERRFGVEEGREALRRASEVLTPYVHLRRRLTEIPWLHDLGQPALDQPPTID